MIAAIRRAAAAVYADSSERLEESRSPQARDHDRLMDGGYERHA
jgi:hypothetical protein